MSVDDKEKPRCVNPIFEYEKYSKQNQQKSDSMVPVEAFFHVKYGKNYENCKGDDFLNYFELGYGIDFVSEAVGGNLKAVLKKSNQPAD